MNRHKYIERDIMPLLPLKCAKCGRLFTVNEARTNGNVIINSNDIVEFNFWRWNWNWNANFTSCSISDEEYNLRELLA